MHSLKNVLLGLAMAVLAACGSEKKEPEPITAPERPNIEQGPANAVSYVEGSYDRPYKLAVSSDAWYLVDRSQGIIRVDQATQESEVIAKFKANDAESLIESAAAIELNGDESALFVLDTEAKQIVSIDLVSAEQTQFVASEAFAVSDNFAWYAPTDLVMDADNGRLLVGDRYGFIGQGYFAFAIFSVDLASKDIQVIAEEGLLASPLQAFEARAFAYDPVGENFYVSGILELSDQYFYAAYRISAVDWARKVLTINTSRAISRNSAVHDVYFSEDSGVYLVDSSARSMVNLSFDGDKTNTKIIPLSSDGKDYPMLRPSAFYFTGESSAILLDESMSAILSVEFEVSTERDEQGVETDYSAESTRSLLASGKRVYADPTVAPQIVFDLHYHQASGKLMITDAADSQTGMLSFDNSQGGGFSTRDLVPQIENLSGTKENPRTYSLDEGEGVDDVRPTTVSTPKPMYISTDTNGDLIVFADSFRIESQDPVVNIDDDGNEVSVTFYYDFYGPALYRVDPDTFQASPISVRENNASSLDFVNTPFFPSDVIGMAVSEEGVYFLPGNPYYRGTFVLYHWNFENKRFYQIAVDLASDVRSPLPSDIEYDFSSGEFILTDAINDALLKFDPEERVISTLSGRMNNGDMVFSLPSGLATDQGITAYTFENSLKALVEVDMSTGDRTRLDSTTNYIRSVSKLTYDADGKTIYLLEKLSQRIIAIDLDTLEQSWVE